MKPRRIFYAAHPSPNVFAFPDSQLWHQNLFVPLVDLGHDVVPFKYDLTPHMVNRTPEYIARNRPRLEAELLRQIEAEHRRRPIDIFFSYFYSHLAGPEVIREIGRLGIVTVNWYCNGAHQFDLVEELAPAYDFCLVPEQFRLEDYRRIGANPIYCQEAANPNVYRPFDLPVEFDVVFVGQRYGDRPRYIRRLLDDGIDVRVWGPGWLPRTVGAGQMWRNRLAALRSPEGWRAAARRLSVATAPPAATAAPPDAAIPYGICGPPLPDDELVKTYSRARISLGFSSVGETHASGQRIVQVRLRDFEAPMSGAFYMVEYMAELEQFFEVGKEIVCYQGPDDLADKVRYYLAHDAERERIRAAGRARALRDHTWQRRFEVALTEMGFD